MRDRSSIAEAAHETLRQRGPYKRDDSYLIRNNPARTDSARAKIRAVKLERNWMKGRIGALHHLYLGGKIWWRGKEWDEIKLRVRARDAFVCADCDMTEVQHLAKYGQPLQVHHLIPFRISHDNSSQNLLTLCSYHHGKRKVEESALIEDARPFLPVAT